VSEELEVPEEWTFVPPQCLKVSACCHSLDSQEPAATLWTVSTTRSCLQFFPTLTSNCTNPLPSESLPCIFTNLIPLLQLCFKHLVNGIPSHSSSPNTALYRETSPLTPSHPALPRPANPVTSRTTPSTPPLSLRGPAGGCSARANLIPGPSACAGQSSTAGPRRPTAFAGPHADTVDVTRGRTASCYWRAGGRSLLVQTRAGLFCLTAAQAINRPSISTEKRGTRASACCCRPQWPGFGNTDSEWLGLHRHPEVEWDGIPFTFHLGEAKMEMIGDRSGRR
jgi:hypothetical protein